MELGSDSRHF